MSRSPWLLLPLLSSVAALACGGGGSGGAGGAGGGGLPPIADECEKNADCGLGSCSNLTSTYEVCTDEPPPEVTSCEPLTTSACCNSTDCGANGKCFDVPICSGIAASQHACVSDECDAATPCPAGSLCAPAGTAGWPGSKCLPATCQSDADCTAEANGVCALLRLGCCKLDASVGCVYPTGCTEDEGCPEGEHCELDAAGAGRCAAGPSMCPA